ncbi:unnamed protein product [Caenorhabditis angaria]|uniref:B box-type domain-containing protein n=1 Tax=Caenorhabditis angaria TaxID=860376 RepID=A0A9P1ISM7_9PELO|nr:unnamed protein product [Caenorhabditis angaria]
MTGRYANSLVPGRRILDEEHACAMAGYFVHNSYMDDESEIEENVEAEPELGQNENEQENVAGVEEEPANIFAQLSAQPAPKVRKNMRKISSAPKPVPRRGTRKRKAPTRLVMSRGAKKYKLEELKMLRPRGTTKTTLPGQKLEVSTDPFAKCMKCDAALSGITKFPKTMEDLSIFLNCAHVFCAKCVKLHDSNSSAVNRSRPAHCFYDFQCGICGLMSAPLTIPNNIRICERKYCDECLESEDCKCEVCLSISTPTSKINNMAYCKMHENRKIEYYCKKCGKHLCQICKQQFKADFKDGEHILTEIVEKDLEIEDDLMKVADFYEKIEKIEKNARNSMENMENFSKTMKKSINASFLSIINTAIHRFSRILTGIREKETYVQKIAGDLMENCWEAKRRIEIAKEIDDLARDQLLIDEVHVADCYQMIAQNMFRKSEEIFEEANKNETKLKFEVFKCGESQTPVELTLQIFNAQNSPIYKKSPKFATENDLFDAKLLGERIARFFEDFENFDYKEMRFEDEKEAETNIPQPGPSSSSNPVKIVPFPSKKSMEYRINRKVLSKNPASITEQQEPKAYQIPQPGPSSSSNPVKIIPFPSKKSMEYRVNQKVLSKHLETIAKLQEPIVYQIPQPNPENVLAKNSADPKTVFINSLHKSKIYNSLSPEHQFYVLKQAEILRDAENLRQKQGKFSDSDELVANTMYQVRINELIQKLYESEKNSVKRDFGAKNRGFIENMQNPSTSQQFLKKNVSSTVPQDSTVTQKEKSATRALTVRKSTQENSNLMEKVPKSEIKEEISPPPPKVAKFSKKQ